MAALRFSNINENLGYVSFHSRNTVNLCLFVFLCSFSSITGNFAFQPCSHGDFLGSILGTGISRGRLGDILLQVCLIH